MFLQSIAVLYQAAPVPKQGDTPKPMKAGGYRDSGADIAYALKRRNVPIVTPVERPNPSCELDWVFEDSPAGFKTALELGANVLWTNTVLYPGHPLDSWTEVARIGQPTSVALIAENKSLMDDWLLRGGFPAVPHQVLAVAEHPDAPFPFPLIVKPVRGRGSQGVVWVNSVTDWDRVLVAWPENRFGPLLLVEPALPGIEITVTVMPSGEYDIAGRVVPHETCWTLPIIERFGHVAGIMPYSGVVAVRDNSRVWQMSNAPGEELARCCADIGTSLGIRAPLRIDARADGNGRFRIFDVNMKPNLTGPGRPGRDNQASLVAMAGEAIGWSYEDLLENIARQWWLAGAESS